MRKVDLLGQKFGKLTVIKELKDDNNFKEVIGGHGNIDWVKDIYYINRLKALIEMKLHRSCI